MATANIPVNCPNCGASRIGSPGFDAGQTLCTGCEDQMHDHEMTIEQDEHFASRYHCASKMLSAEWGWGHSHDCPDCADTFYCEQQDCKPGPQACQTCEDFHAAQTVPTQPGYRDTMSPSDTALIDL